MTENAKKKLKKKTIANIVKSLAYLKRDSEKKESVGSSYAVVIRTMEASIFEIFPSNQNAEIFYEQKCQT